MNNLELFFKQNAIEKENIKCVVSNRYQDENQNPLEWELKAITASEDTILREKCTGVAEVPGKKGQFMPKFNTTEYMSMLAAASVLYPELGNAALQDSYGVNNKLDLLKAMLLPGEFQDLLTKIQEINGYKSFEELVEEAKN
ncbi:phage tail assembly chaperone [Fusobacterium ulcerans]|jgi:hypothetical protein|uniref:phage tail assembly chaperone n=1 Tax=Fusobacterium ulcerans TaxID=861 RepID=UPI00204974FD|nr:MAG TPA: tail assembly chaperone protein [Caudoviricetes sp.]